MCGLYRLAADAEKVRQRLAVAVPAEDAGRALVRPGEVVGIIRQRQDGWRWQRVVWGMHLPVAGKDGGRRVINARAEGLLQRPLFREAVRWGRCLVVADGFHEWTGRRGAKRAVLFTLPDERVFAMAGLWTVQEMADGTRRAVMSIITVPANGDVRPVHERMPALLRREHWAPWLDGDGVAPAQAVRLLRPAPDGMLRAREAGNPLRRQAAGMAEPVARQGDLLRDAGGGA